jgi:hypothetical protein
MKPIWAALFWPLLTVAMVIHSCSSSDDWQQRYDNATPEQRLTMDREILQRVRQYNAEHHIATRDSSDEAEALRNVEHDLARVASSKSNGQD